MTIPDTKNGFTIIETLVAITVLMFAIAGPLVAASNGLTGALASKDQMIASYLAQESMEVIKNARDNNLANVSRPNWLLSPSNTDMGACKQGNLCDASVISNTQVGGCSSSGGCPLYLGANGYSHDSNASNKTQFSRRFFLSGPACSDAGSECTVTVVVDWNEGVTPYEISLSSELVNTTR